MKSKIFIYVFTSAFLLVLFLVGNAQAQREIRITMGDNVIPEAKDSLLEKVNTLSKEFNEHFGNNEFCQMAEKMEEEGIIIIGSDYRRKHKKDDLEKFWQGLKQTATTILDFRPVHIYITGVIPLHHGERVNQVAFISWEFHVIDRKGGAPEGNDPPGAATSSSCHLDNCSWRHCRE